MTGRARRQQRKRARARGPAPKLSSARMGELFRRGWAYECGTHKWSLDLRRPPGRWVVHGIDFGSAPGRVLTTLTLFGRINGVRTTVKVSA